MSEEAKKASAHIGVVFEEKNLYPRMTAEANLKFFAKLFRKKVDVGALLERVGLGGKGKERVENFSKGMKQRLMVGRALVNDPEVLFLDEPTGGLDPVSAETIRGIILDEKKRGVSILLTTHDMMEADRLSDRVAFINEGKIAVIDTPEKLKVTFGRRLLVVRFPDGTAQRLSLDDPETPSKVEAMIRQGRVETMHTTEATLEEIFMHVTGRRL